jgi:hypothetical protein
VHGSDVEGREKPVRTPVAAILIKPKLNGQAEEG